MLISRCERSEPLKIEMTSRDKAVDLLYKIWEPPGLGENVAIDRKPFEEVVDLIIQAARENMVEDLPQGQSSGIVGQLPLDC